MTDRERLRTLAHRWKEHAESPRMEEKKKQWAKLHSLRSVKPMILVETVYIEDYLDEKDLQCSNPFFRKLEKFLLEKLIHTEEIGDDIVLENCFRIGWKVHQPSFGVDINRVSSKNGGMAYRFSNPIKSPEDVLKLAKRKFSVDEKGTLNQKAFYKDLFGDILPIAICNFDFLDPPGCFDWIGNFFFGLTWQIHRFVGLDTMLYWYIDEPETMHSLLRYMTDDRLSMFKMLEDGGFLCPNTDNQMAGPRFYGYCDDFIKPEGPAGLDHLWAWCESQESSGISPEMYKEFVLPYLAELSGYFGKIYYGCCEPVHDKIEILRKEIPNIRAFSVSQWNDFNIIGELIGRDYVYSRKPAPACLSGNFLDWNSVQRDIDLTWQSARNCHLEFLLRDVYRINHDRARLTNWVNMVKRRFYM